MARSTLSGAKRLKERLGSLVTDDKVRAALLTACDEEAGVAQRGFNDFAGSYPGNGSVSVTSRKGDGVSAEIVASGPSVTFIEYGSGVKDRTLGRNAAKHGFTPGSWSMAHARAIRGFNKSSMGSSRDLMWVYRGEGGGDAEPVRINGSDKVRAGYWWTTGSDGANVMADAADRLRKSAAKAVRRKIAR